MQARPLLLHPPLLGPEVGLGWALVLGPALVKTICSSSEKGSFVLSLEICHSCAEEISWVESQLAQEDEGSCLVCKSWSWWPTVYSSCSSRSLSSCPWGAPGGNSPFQSGSTQSWGVIFCFQHPTDRNMFKVTRVQRRAVKHGERVRRVDLQGTNKRTYV